MPYILLVEMYVYDYIQFIGHMLTSVHITQYGSTVYIGIAMVYPH